MSRLDQHVAAVRNKLAMVRFVDALSWALNLLALGVILTLLVVRVFDLSIPYPREIFWGALGLCVLAAMVWAMVMRPSARLAAVAIDEKLGLKEKLSTALFMRSSPDEFAKAAVKDAEKTAENVALNLGMHFPLRFPRAGYVTMGLGVCAFLVAWLMPTLDLFGREESRKQQAQLVAQQKTAEQAVKRVLAAVEQQPKALQDNEAIRNAKITLEKLLQQGVKDPAQASRTALQAAQEVQEALKKEAMNNAKYAIAQDEMQRRKNLMPSPDEKGPVAEAQREMAKGNFSEAIAKLNDVASRFDQMDKPEQEKAAQQMQQLAQQLQQLAQQQQNPQQQQQQQQQLQNMDANQQQMQNLMQQAAQGNQQAQQQQNPQQQQQQQQQLQNMGANQQQAQQMQNLMQQAAQGNQQAQQQLQQMAQQVMQQMNNGQGPTAQQQQQMQQMLAQMQAQANNAANAQQMAQAAQAMAQAMQQGAQGQQGQQGQQNMQQAMQQMQQQLQDMEAMAADAQQVAAAQQAMQDAADQAAGACNGEGDGQGNGMAGDWKPGDPNQKGGDGKGGGAGQASGQRSGPEAAPFGVKQEISKSQDNNAGKLLAANYIKDNAPLKGDAKESLKEVAASAEREAAEEVDQERVSRQAAKAVKEYFNSLGQEEPAELAK